MAGWIAAATVGSAIIGNMSQNKAQRSAEAQEGRNRADQLAWNQQQDPFSAGGNREQYVGRLNDLMQGGYSKVAQDPIYQGLNNQSLDDLQRKMGARGKGGSGEEMLALRNTSQRNLMSFFDAQYNRLSELSGASRGGGSAPRGMSPETTYQMGADQGQQMGNLFGAGMGVGSRMQNAPGSRGYWMNQITPNASGGVTGL